MKKIKILIVLLTVSLLTQAQNQPKRIKAKYDYLHIPTNLIFPLKIDNYERKEIYSFDKKETNIGVNYGNIDDNGRRTLFSIYVYPAGDGTEDRLRDQYLMSMQSIANVSQNGIHATQYPVSYKNSGYKINGFKADLKNTNQKSNLSVYECGRWFFKIRVTTDNLDTTQLTNLDARILDLFNPTNLVRVNPLNPKASVYYSKAAFVDSLMLGSAIGSALKKIEWAWQNVDSLERASGFPGLYLNMHIVSLREFVQFEKQHPDFSKSKSTTEYLTELNSIINGGYLKEFIMDQFGMIMIVPKDSVFNFEGFKEWKTKNQIKIDLNKRFYVISYNQ